jgi:hypothetical protein
VRQRIQQWHGGQLLIVWVVFIVLIPIAGYAAYFSGASATAINERRELAIKDSVARTRMDSSAIISRFSALLRQGYSNDLAIRVLKDETGLQDSSFHRPTAREIRNASLLRVFVSYPFAIVAILLLPAAIVITWIWLSGRRNSGSQSTTPAPSQ